MRIIPIAVNTFKETIRNRILLNILIFAIALILLSLVISDWSLGEQIKVIQDFGLSAMSVFGLLIAVFIGIRLMIQELEQRTIYMIASKPVNRWEIVLGKFLGLSATLAINVLIMTLTLWCAEWIMRGQFEAGLIPAVILIYIEILLIVAFAIFFSTIVSPTLAALFTVAIFITGHLSGFLYDYILIHSDSGLHWLYRMLYYILPNLEKLNIKMAVVHGHAQPPVTTALSVLYGSAYIIIILIITSLIFEKKDLK